VAGIVGEGDVCVVMGAGDVDQLARSLLAGEHELAAAGAHGERGGGSAPGASR
jgi:hypothetical protein